LLGAPLPEACKMPLKDLLKKKEKISEEATPHKGPTLSPEVPEFQFYRSTTTTQEQIAPPTFPGDPVREQALLSPNGQKRFSRFRRHSNADEKESERKSEHRLSERLHIGRTRSSSSVNVPDNLPEVGEGVARNDEDEAKWEKRATIMANTLPKSGSTTPNIEVANPLGGRTRSRSPSVSNAGDVSTQAEGHRQT
jgi:hypothetical protein